MSSLHYIIITVFLLVLVMGMRFVYPKLKVKQEAKQLAMEDTEGQSKVVLWLKRIGFAGFMFFLIKGLVWLAIFYFAGKSF